MRRFDRVAVFCGSSNAPGERWFSVARAFGAALASRGIGVVYGGGGVGLMNALADGALAADGDVIGVIPAALLDFELGRSDLVPVHAGAPEPLPARRLEVVADMHARKARMAALSDAFVALPGGYGTMEELFEALTWTQLRFHDKPVGVLDADGFWAPLLAWIARASAEGFVRPQHRDLLQISTDPADLLDRLARCHLPAVDSWIRDP